MSSPSRSFRPGLLSRVAAWRPLTAGLLALVLAVLADGPRAWDADRMTAAARKLGPNAVTGAQALQQLLAGSNGLDDAARLQAVNTFYNRRVLFRDDTEVWNQVDYWASPFETLQRGQGDCEDFAIAKYFTLVTLGMPVNRLRLVYVRAQVGGPQGAVQAHMVLAYHPTPEAEPLILDNLIGEIRPASRRPDLAPVFSFNGDGLWQGVGSQPAGNPVARLSRWREVLAKAQAEGFQ
ncbi:transglutaminase-like cysteine peptidase [Rhizobacter sp. LjRoot28]|uniref:transglutaminase-like cysteine peptidase n=1 Tax=Rhizobacter sp. LjRoot28 TaxID=3342309 RepID=UPI003ECF4A2B